MIKKLSAAFAVVALFVVASNAAIVQLDTENNDYDLTSQQTVLTHTPNASNPMRCQGALFLGDGSKDLDGTGGDFELSITVGGVVLQPEPYTMTFSTDVRCFVQTFEFSVPANTAVTLAVLSPNAADTDVDVTAYLYQTDAADVIAVSGDLTAANNLESACDNYSATRGLAGTALPGAVADAAGGLVISDAGNLDIDVLYSTATTIAADVAGLNGDAMRGTDGAITALTGIATEAKQDVAQTSLNTIAADVENLDGDAMRGTDAAYTGTPPTSGTIAAAVWDLDTTSHTTAGTFGEKLFAVPTVAEIDTQLSSTHGYGVWDSLPGESSGLTASEVDSVLTASHGSGSWQSSGASGANTVTVTVEDSNSTAIPDVVLRLMNSDETVLLDAKITDANGQLYFELDDGSYLIRPRKSGYTFTLPESLTVSGTTLDTIIGTYVVPSATDPDVQAAYGNIRDIAGQNIEGAIFEAVVSKGNKFSANSFIGMDIYSATSDANGDVTLPLIKGGSATVTVLTSKRIVVAKKTFTVTDDDTRNLKLYFE